jgi:hypothetical protein
MRIEAIQFTVECELLRFFMYFSGMRADSNIFIFSAMSDISNEDHERQLMQLIFSFLSLMRIVANIFWGKRTAAILLCK